MHILALVSVLLSLASAARSALTPVELEFKTYLKEHRQAVIKIFLDSTQEAPEGDIEKVKAQLGYFALHLRILIGFLSESYATRCWERVPSSGRALNQVCSVSMDSSSNFSSFVDVLSCEDALNFYLLPPGRFRDSVREKAMTGEDVGLDLYNHIMSRDPALSVPYKEALVDVQTIFTESVIMSLKGRVRQLPFIDQIEGSNEHIGSKTKVHFKIGVPRGGQGILAAVFPANCHTLLLDPPQDELEQAHGEVLIGGPAHPQPGIPFENIIHFELLRLTDPISNSHVNVMETLNESIWELNQLWRKSKSRSIETAMVSYGALVEAVLLRNPEALLLNPKFSTWKNIERAADRFAKSYLDALVDRILQGKLAVATIDNVLLEFLVNKIEDKWDRMHYRRFLSNYCKQTERPIDKDIWSSNVAPLADVLQTMMLPADVRSLLAVIPTDLAKAFNRSFLGANASFLKIFLDEMCGTHGRSGLLHAFYKLKHMKSTIISEFEVKAAQSLLSGVLTAKEVDVVLMYDFHERVFPWTNIDSNLEHSQRYMLNSLIFMTGSFEPRKEAKFAQKNYWNAMETIAWIFHPVYVEKLRTVRAHFEEVKNIELLIQCPYVDKRWILEQYGVMETNEGDSRSLLRLFNSDEEVSKCVTEGIWEGMSDSSNSGLASVNYNIKILEFAISKGKVDAVRSVLIIPPHYKLLIDQCILEMPTVDISGNLDSEILQNWFSIYAHNLMSAERVLENLDQNKSLKTGGDFDTATVQKVVELICQREFQRDAMSPAPSWPSCNIYKLLDLTFYNRQMTILIINRCCQMARTLEDLENIFQFRSMGGRSARFVSLIIEYFSTPPEVEFDFAIYLLSVALNRRYLYGDIFGNIVSRAWWHVLSIVRDKNVATKMLIKKCQQFGVDLDEVTINAHLKKSNFLAQYGYNYLSKNTIKDVVEESKKSILLFVFDEPILVPSCATAKHLYGIVHQRRILNYPFILIDEADGTEVSLFDDATIESLAYRRLKDVPSDIGSVLKIGLGKV